MTLTTVSKVEQVDEDKFVIYRRQDIVTSDLLSYEKVTFDRAAKTVTSELITPGLGGAERVVERGVL